MLKLLVNIINRPRGMILSHTTHHLLMKLHAFRMLAIIINILVNDKTELYSLLFEIIGRVKYFPVFSVIVIISFVL